MVLVKSSCDLDTYTQSRKRPNRSNIQNLPESPSFHYPKTLPIQESSLTLNQGLANLAVGMLAHIVTLVTQPSHSNIRLL